MKFFYVNDFVNEAGNAIVAIDDDNAMFYFEGVRPYKRRSSAAAYVKSFAEGKTNVSSETVLVARREPNESPKFFENRMVGEVEHLACFERIYPKDPLKVLATPKTYFKCLNIFSGEYLWYTSQKEAKKDADGTVEVYVGEVEVYDPKEIERLDQIIASYPAD